MIDRNFVRRTASACGLALALFMTGGVLENPTMDGLRLVTPAEAKVVIQRTTIYINTLPSGCVRQKYGNYIVWRCGNYYYQPYKGRYVRVTITTVN